jgi:hypothetical protein
MDMIKEEIFPLYLYFRNNFREAFKQKPPMNDGDELIFRILMLFLSEKEVGKESVQYNYMPQWLKGIKCDLSEAKIIHYSGPIKHILYQLQLFLECNLPTAGLLPDFKYDTKVDELLIFS